MKSKSFPERIAIIEFDSSHDECLLTQVNALKSRGCWVMLVTNELVRSRNSHLEALADEWSCIDNHGGNLSGAAIGDAMIIRRIMRFLKKRNIDKVIFNTAQGGHVRNACLFSLFRKMEFIGIIHTIRKFQGSFTQRIINLKMKKYLVLADFLKERVVSTSNNLSTMAQSDVEGSHGGSMNHLHNSKLTLASFYPLDFPKSDHASGQNDSLHISIIGSVELRRKDLNGFVSFVEQSDTSVQFSLLGIADPKASDVIKLKEELEKIGCLDRVEFFQQRIEFTEIDQILRKTNAILPLVHPDTPSADEYFRNQIPGAMNMALGYKIPLLMHKSFRNIEELNPASIYYDIKEFSKALDKLKSKEASIRLAMSQTKKYSSEYQQKAYLGFIFNS